MKLHEALSAVTRDVAEIMDNAAPQEVSTSGRVTEADASVGEVHYGQTPPAVSAPYSVTRQKKQLVIEEMVASFNPDAYEATELLDSLWAGVMERYGADEVVDLSKEFQELREALLEFDRTYKPSSAQDVKDWINDDEAARKAGL